MTARHKLNSVYIIASLVAAAVIGAIFGSWIVFLIAAATLIGLSLHSGDIRPSSSGRRKR